MLYKIIFEIEKKQEINLTYNISSLFHGFLMEQINPAFATEMHAMNLRPYSQHLHFADNRIFWMVCALNDRVYENLGQPLLENSLQTITLKHKKLELPILSKSVKSISFDSFLEQTFWGEHSRVVHLRFLTPCSFKTQGKYLFYPTVKHIIQSLAMKFDAAGYDYSVYTPEMVADLAENVSIVQYNLRSQSFQLEGVKIPAFVGNITLKVFGASQIVNLLHMLLAFGEYSGIGIKCALGMGAVKMEERGARHNGQK
jgi:CRISPR-associated endoribonuclease Cas6